MAGLWRCTLLPGGAGSPEAVLVGVGVLGLPGHGDSPPGAHHRAVTGGETWPRVPGPCPFIRCGRGPGTGSPWLCLTRWPRPPGDHRAGESDSFWGQTLSCMKGDVAAPLASPAGAPARTWGGPEGGSGGRLGPWEQGSRALKQTGPGPRGRLRLPLPLPASASLGHPSLLRPAPSCVSVSCLDVANRKEKSIRAMDTSIFFDFSPDDLSVRVGAAPEGGQICQPFSEIIVVCFPGNQYSSGPGRMLGGGGLGAAAVNAKRPHLSPHLLPPNLPALPAELGGRGAWPLGRPLAGSPPRLRGSSRNHSPTPPRPGPWDLAQRAPWLRPRLPPTPPRPPVCPSSAGAWLPLQDVCAHGPSAWNDLLPGPL